MEWRGQAGTCGCGEQCCSLSLVRCAQAPATLVALCSAAILGLQTSCGCVGRDPYLRACPAVQEYTLADAQQAFRRTADNHRRLGWLIPAAAPPRPPQMDTVPAEAAKVSCVQGVAAGVHQAGFPADTSKVTSSTRQHLCVQRSAKQRPPALWLTRVFPALSTFHAHIFSGSTESAPQLTNSDSTLLVATLGCRALTRPRLGWSRLLLAPARRLEWQRARRAPAAAAQLPARRPCCACGRRRGP